MEKGVNDEVDDENEENDDEKEEKEKTDYESNTIGEGKAVNDERVGKDVALVE